MVRFFGIGGEKPDASGISAVVMPAVDLESHPPVSGTTPDPVIPDQGAPSDLPRLLPTAYQMVFEESPVGIGLADEHGRFLAVNAALCALFGRDRDELIGHTSVAYTYPEDRPDHRKAGDLVRTAEDRIGRVEKRYLHPDGTIRWAWLSFTHVSGPQGQVWTIAHMQDVTERKAAEQALQESEATLRAVAAVMQRIRNGQDVRPSIVAAAIEMAGADAAVLWEPGSADDLVITAASDASLTGLSIPAGTTHPALRCFGTVSASSLNQDPHDPPIFPVGIAGTAMGSSLLVPVSVQGRSVAVLQVGWTGPGSRRERSQPLQVLAVLADQAAVAVHQARLVTDLERLAGTDALTGLPNRRSWDLTLPTLMTEALRTGQDLVVALADLDRFKEFNDEFGHPAGDRLLRELSPRLRENLRKADVIARWGGEEFAVALLLDRHQDPWFALERMRAAIPQGATSSVGFARWSGTESAGELVERADRALYRAKAEGRDRIAAAPPPPRPTVLPPPADAGSPPPSVERRPPAAASPEIPPAPGLPEQRRP